MNPISQQDCGIVSSDYRGFAARRGITLLEVLISILILAVGVLSVAALLPVGAYQAAQGRIADRTATLGQSALREFKIRGLTQADQWLKSDGSKVVDNNGNFTITLPVCIDPWWIARNGPSTPGLPNGMRRLTVNNLNNRPAADQIFESQDDLTFDRPTDGESRPSQVMMGGMKRQSDRQFSWMAMLTPTEGDDGAIFPQKLATLSVVVFNRRSNLPTYQDVNNKTISLENTFDCTVNSGYGGMSITLRAPFYIPPEIKAGSWALVSGVRAKQAVPTYKWYKVGGVNLDTSNPSTPPQFVGATLIGPDWDYSSTSGVATVQVTFVDGVVGVYQKTIRLEGPSLWTN